jgi:hypothetical protein
LCHRLLNNRTDDSHYRWTKKWGAGHWASRLTSEGVARHPWKSGSGPSHLGAVSEKVPLTRLADLDSFVGQEKRNALRVSLLRLAEPSERQEHSSLLSISPVLLAVEADQIPLFELQGDEDVSGRREGKQEMPEGHRWTCPEGEQKPQHERVADIAIEPRGFERGRRVLLPGCVEVDLAEPEQVEMVNQERGHEHESPAGPEDGMEQPATNWGW